MERSSIQRVIDYLDVVKTPHKNTSETSVLWTDLKAYLRQYDDRRKKDLSKALDPRFTDWLSKVDA